MCSPPISGSEAGTAGGPEDGSDLGCGIFLYHPQYHHKGHFPHIMSFIACNTMTSFSLLISCLRSIICNLWDSSLCITNIFNPFSGVWHEPPLHLPLGQVWPIGAKWNDVDHPAHHDAHHSLLSLWLDGRAGDEHHHSHPHHREGGVWAKDRNATEAALCLLWHSWKLSLNLFITVI